MKSSLAHTVRIAHMAHSPGLTPAYQTDGSAGFDIPAAEEMLIPARCLRVIKTGLKFEVPPGFELQIRSRSGMAAKDTMFVLNSPGTLDSDYRGELMILLMNLGDIAFTVTRGMRIAQAVLSPVTQARLEFVREDDLSVTARGENRFGSTGR